MLNSVSGKLQMVKTITHITTNSYENETINGSPGVVKHRTEVLFLKYIFCKFYTPINNRIVLTYV